MKKAICGFIYYKLLGWKTKVSVPDYDKYIICAAPHTTNWDLFIGKLFMGAIGRETGFMMKKDWFFWPLGPIFRWMGGIPVDRSRKTSLVDQMIKIAKSSQKFHLAITPEGTRKNQSQLEERVLLYCARGRSAYYSGSYRLREKCITAEKVIHPSGDLDKDMREIKLYYKISKANILKTSASEK